MMSGHVDVKDTAARGVHKVVNYGSGVTDMHGIIERVLHHGYTGYLILERGPPINRESLIADLVRARQMFQQYMR
jgi:sugar phosphate isomerase/epimerase